MLKLFLILHQLHDPIGMRSMDALNFLSSPPEINSILNCILPVGAYKLAKEIIEIRSLRNDLDPITYHAYLYHHGRKLKKDDSDVATAANFGIASFSSLYGIRNGHYKN